MEIININLNIRGDHLDIKKVQIVRFSDDNNRNKLMKFLNPNIPDYVIEIFHKISRLISFQTTENRHSSLKSVKFSI